MSAPGRFKWAIALQLAWFPALFIAWVVIAAGTIQGDALRFGPTGADAARDTPQFCLWPDNVEHLRAH